MFAREGEDLTVDDRRHLITDAGQIVPDFKLEKDEVEFFCHSPFIKHVDSGDDLRNEAALIFNIRFKQGNTTFDYLLIGDSEWEVLEDIVRISKKHGNEDRLEWDLFNIPHHCSYLALSDEKGEKETTPKNLVEELLQKGRINSYMVSSSNEIKNDSAAYKQTQPPHIQAKNCYKKYMKKNDGANLYVTMEEPNTTSPEPLIFEIKGNGLIRESKAALAAPIAITSNPTPRSGMLQKKNM